MNTTSRPLGVTNVMADICTHDVVSYLKENYITAEDASRRAGVSEMRLWQLVDSKCVPPQSHTCQSRLYVTTNIAGAKEIQDAEVCYFHPDVVGFIKKAQRLALSGHSLDEISELMKTHFSLEAAKALGKPPEQIPEVIEESWNQLMAGTYGVCLKRISAADMVQKERAVYRMKKLTDQASREGLTFSIAQKLREQLKSYNEVSADFGPHEIATSSRGEVADKAEQLVLSLGQEPLQSSVISWKNVSTSNAGAGGSSGLFIKPLERSQFPLAERLWFEVYVEEMHRQQEYTDYAERRISDPLQATARIIGAFNGNELIGTVRTNYSKDMSLGYYEELYDLGSLGHNSLSESAVVTRIVVKENFRRTTSSVRLASNMFHMLAQDGVRWILCDCNDPVLDFFLRLGFEIHKKNAEHPDYGPVTVLKIDTQKTLGTNWRKSLLGRYAY